MSNEKARESKARREAAKQGFMLRKSRARDWSMDNCQGYNMLCAHSGSPCGLGIFEYSLEAVEDFLGISNSKESA